MESNTLKLLCFVIDSQKYALPLDSVEVVIRSQAITVLESSVASFCGIIDFHGEIIPVISLRKRFGLADHTIRITDRFIIVKLDNKKAGIIADDVGDIIYIQSDQIIESSEIFKGLRYIRILNRENGIILIYDMNSIFNEEEEIELLRLSELYPNVNI
ncbi:MAG: chemotaxis protein CheW [Rikenellaceae bacterium]